MSEREDDSELIKWLTGDLSDQELEKSQSKEDVANYKRILSEVETWRVPEVDKAKGFAALHELRTGRQKKETKVVSMLPKWVGLAAASVSLLIIGVWVILSLRSDETVVATTFGETKQITFPDGSRAVLNANSAISYIEEDWPSMAEVTLSRGEVYFYGEHSDNFRVLADGRLVDVLGTRFTVKTIDDYFAALCYEGSISVAFQSSTDVHLLDGGESLRILSSGELIFESVEDEVPIWVEGNRTKFKNAPLFEVFSAIEDQFGLTLVYEGNLDLNQKYTGTFVYSNVELALKMVCDPASLQFEKLTDKQYRIY